MTRPLNYIAPPLALGMVALIALVELACGTTQPPNATTSESTPTSTRVLTHNDWFYVEFWRSAEVKDVRALLERGADIKARGGTIYGSNDWTPLHFAAGLNDNPEVISFLLDRGADIEAKDDNGDTPLFSAAFFNDNLEVVSVLLDRGADINAKNKYGRTPLHSAAGNYDNPEVVALLLDRGAGVNSRDERGETPLHYATLQNDLEVVVVLLDRGADIGAKDHFGRRACDLSGGKTALANTDARRRLCR